MPEHTGRRGRAGHLVLAWLVTLAFVLPIYIALSSAFKTQEQILANPLALPAPFTFDNILNALQRPGPARAGRPAELGPRHGAHGRRS